MGTTSEETTSEETVSEETVSEAEDLVIIGGGVIGLAIADRCAGAGLRPVVVDPAPGSGASGVAAGMLAPVTELHYGEDGLLALNLESARMFGDWVGDVEERSGLPTGYRQNGTVMVARDSDDLACLAHVWEHQESLELKAERLRGSELRRIEPGLAGTVRGGILVPDDHQVDPPALARALHAACERRGVRFLARRVEGLVVEEGRLRGVRLDDGAVVACERTVVAAGCWSGRLEGLVGEASIPVRPVKGQLLELRSRGGEPVLHRNVRGIDVYMVPRADGRVVVGATVEEQGFDLSVTAGAVFELLRSAYELVPGIAELELTGARAGLRPGTPDNAPLLGPSSVTGVTVATGHFRNGILLAPVTAVTIAELLISDRVPASIAAFDPMRFAEGAA